LNTDQKENPPVTGEAGPRQVADEPAVTRWPRAGRLVFLLLAAAACWGAIMLIAWLALRRRAL